MTEKISEEQIESFLNGRDPQEGIISIECGYADDEVSIIYKGADEVKRIKKEGFKPFIWAKKSGARRLFVSETHRQDKDKLKRRMDSYGIRAKSLNIFSKDGKTSDRLENGYRVMFTATKPMSYSSFIRFFKEAGVDLYDGTKDFLCISPVEQYMMRSGKRFFKGFENYDDLLRLQFDLETEGLNPEVHRISQIGIRTNKGFELVIPIEGETEKEKNLSEFKAINLFFKTVSELKPDVIAGHNSENFDWNFIIVRCEVLGSNIADVSGQYFRQALYKSKKKTVLKLGGEMEYFNKTNLWGYNIVDSLHAVRRAQAIDSNIKKADLKYVTKYSKLNKPNRVYVPGDKIEKTWQDRLNQYAFNDTDGKWYLIDEKHPIKDNYVITTGRYIVERYLKDDIYETDKVELRYNEANFLLCKLLSTTYARVCTMGTAGIWKLIMMAWSFENNLGIPELIERKTFTGGLSRLLKVGYVDKVVKLDYNSLYPSIILTWDISTEQDITGVMLSLLNYILTQREKYKDLKAKSGSKVKIAKKELELLKEDTPEYKAKKREIKKWDASKNANDKKQLPLKITANSFFGSYGSNLFPWADAVCAEKTTCTGRQCLRLMIKWFSEKGYTPIVGDSIIGDTPLFIKYNDSNLLDIKPISEIFDNQEHKIDGIGREYDVTIKDYKVLCRNGWHDVNYVYRHKTNKNIHRVEFEGGLIDVTADHSLFDSNKNKIHSKDINSKTELEEFKGKIGHSVLKQIKEHNLYELGEKIFENKKIDRIPTMILNCNIEYKKEFIKGYLLKGVDSERTKTFIAGIEFIKREIK
jgi:hypothetical protein